MQNYNFFSRLYNKHIVRKASVRLNSPNAVGILYYAESVKDQPDLLQVVCQVRLPGPRIERIPTGFTYLASDGDEAGLSKLKNPERYQTLIELRQAIWLTVAQHIRLGQHLDTALLHLCCDRFREGCPSAKPTDWYYGYLLATAPTRVLSIEQQRTDMLMIDVLRLTITSSFIKR